MEMGASSALRGPRSCHPARVVPVVVELPHDRGRARRRLGVKGERIGLVDLLAVGALRSTYLYWPLARRRARTPPRCPTRRAGESVSRAGFQPFQSPITYTLRALGAHTAKCVPPSSACALQVVVQPQVRAFVEQVQVVVREQRAHASAKDGTRAGRARLARRPVAAIWSNDQESAQPGQRRHGRSRHGERQLKRGRPQAWQTGREQAEQRAGDEAAQVPGQNLRASKCRENRAAPTLLRAESRRCGAALDRAPAACTPRPARRTPR